MNPEQSKGYKDLTSNEKILQRQEMLLSLAQTHFETGMPEIKRNIFSGFAVLKKKNNKTKNRRVVWE